MSSLDLAGEPLADPGVVMLVEGEVRLRRIDDLRAGIDAGFDRIGLDQRLRETMDCAADQLVEAIVRAAQICPSARARCLSERRSQDPRDLSIRQVADETARCGSSVRWPRTR